VLRRLRELEARATAGAVHYPRALIQLFTEAICLRNQYRPGKVSAGRPWAARWELEERLWRLVKVRRVVPAYQTLSHHLWYYLSDWFTFLEHPEVEPTNAAAERAIRPAVVNRKVCGGNRT
jgi:transposase